MTDFITHIKYMSQMTTNLHEYLQMSYTSTDKLLYKNNCHTKNIFIVFIINVNTLK